MKRYLYSKKIFRCMKIYWLLIPPLLLLLILLLGFNLTTRAPEKPITELYLGSTPDNASNWLRFSFWIANLDTKFRAYNYTIAINGKPLLEGETRLDAEETREVPVVVSLQGFKVGELIQVSVRLEEPQLRTHFWVRVK